jgi:flagellar protein FlaG
MDLSALNDYSPGSAQATADLGFASTGGPTVEDRRAVIQAVRAVNKAEVFGQEHELSFAMDRATRRPVVRIVDRKTRQVVQQIPSESVLRLAEELKKA